MLHLGGMSHPKPDTGGVPGVTVLPLTTKFRSRSEVSRLARP